MKVLKQTILFSMVAGIAALSGCVGKTQPVPFDNGDSIVSVNRDNTIYGVCGDGTAMHTLQIITDLGDTLTVDISNAIENHQVLGGLQGGDRLAVVPNAARTAAVIVINQTSLLGNWVMPNPLDGSDEVGIAIKEGGIVEGIEQNSIEFKTWRLVNGKLEIVSERDNSGEDEINLYDIQKLGNDSLTLSNPDDTFEYARQKPKKLDSDIKLEESNADDYKI